MNERPYILADTTWKTVRKTPYEVAVLPWGAIEAHNYHLTYGTDVVLSDHIAAESARLAWARGAKVIVLPTVPFGVNTGQLDIPLTINMNPSTQSMVLADVIASLAGQRVPKLVLFNGHGGNDFRQMLRELEPRFPSIFLCCLNWYQVVDNDRYFRPGDHAGELETSLMLHIAPQLVQPLAEAGAGTARHFKLRGLQEKWAWAQRRWTRVTADTGVGDPRSATAEKGRVYLKDVTEKIADFLVGLAAADPEEMYEEP